MVASTQALPKSHSSPALFAPWLDMLVLGGLSIALLPLLFYIDRNAPTYYSGATMAQILLIFSILANHPHNAATYYRVYGDLREAAKYKYSAIWAPLLLLIPLVLSYAMPSVVAPWFFKTYFLTVSYHYAGQSYGISLIYARKAGIEFNQFTKALIAIPLFAAAFLWIVGDEVMYHRTAYLGTPLPMLGFPSWLYLLLLAALVQGVMAYVVLNVYLWKSQRMILPVVVQAVVLSHILWFTMGPKSELFNMVVPIFHSIQYILITSYFQWRLLKGTSGPLARGSSGYVEPANHAASHEVPSTVFLGKYYLALIVIGATILIGIPHLIALSGICTSLFSVGLVGTFVSLHHFLLDGEVWKLRKPEIGKALISD